MNASDLYTPDETIAYLKLDVDQPKPRGRHQRAADPKKAARERLRTLVRRHRLPVLKVGNLQRFRKSAIDDWLESGGASPRSNGRKK